MDNLLYIQMLFQTIVIGAFSLLAVALVIIFIVYLVRVTLFQPDDDVDGDIDNG